MVLSGCSSTSTPSSPAAKPKPTTPRDQLVLVQSDFPAGVQIQHIAPGDLAKVKGQFGDIAKDAQVQPAKCGDLRKGLQTADLKDKTSTVVATGGMNSYAAAVMDMPLDLTLIKNTMSGDCATTSVQMTIEGQPVNTTTQTTALPLPAGLNAGEAVSYQEVTETTLPGISTQKSVSDEGYAVVRGMTVQVKTTATNGTPDTAAFDKLFTAAVNKVLNAQ